MSNISILIEILFEYFVKSYGMLILMTSFWETIYLAEFEEIEFCELLWSFLPLEPQACEDVKIVH